MLDALAEVYPVVRETFAEAVAPLTSIFGA